MESLATEPHHRRDNLATYDSAHPIYAMAISAADPHRVAVGSFLEELGNRVNVLTFSDDRPAVASISLSSPALSFDHPYPPTKLLFHHSPSAPASLLVSSSKGCHIPIR
ncbi:carbamoyl-phosphate synthase large chain [Striga asiatica]|uniref:Carbamoyl-phosphate synthase large chain n=1 Tax=Striga asiatica TaxID=4170 RepID=A0A5A7R036_STRAF|nr:carbamoyl-phosphate synthase large chain [Striga asiatica]